MFSLMIVVGKLLRIDYKLIMFVYFCYFFIFKRRFNVKSLWIERGKMKVFNWLKKLVMFVIVCWNVIWICKYVV